MSKGVQNGEEPLGRAALRRAMKAWHDPQQLGEHPIAQLKTVANRHQTTGRNSAPAEWGLSVREVLRAALERLRPDNGLPRYDDERWRSYIILKEKYINGRSRDDLATQLNIVLRTYHYAEADALGKLASVLRQFEDELRQPAPAAPTLAAVPFMAPPKPAYELVGRYNLLEELKGRLFSQGCLALTALNGLPGVGKTALAIELAHDPEVLARFNEGVLWAPLGRQPDVLVLLGGWGMAVGIPSEEVARLNTAVERARAVHRAIGARRLLLVIDDAWQLAAALAFRVGGPHCAYLLTTRQRDLARDFAETGARPVPELNPSAGLVLFSQLAPEVAAADPNGAAELVGAVGGLPLAIILMARWARRQEQAGQGSLREALARLRAAGQRLALAQPQALLDSHPGLPAGASLSLPAVIGISLEALDEPARCALVALAVFPPKPNTFSHEAALAVSAAPPETIHSLVNSGLLEPSGAERYTLHQTIADYARSVHFDLLASCRLAEYFTRYVVAHEQEYPRLDREGVNILAALEAAAEQGLDDTLIQGANALSHFLSDRGLYDQAERHLKRAEQVARSLSDAAGLTTTLLNLGTMSRRQGSFEQSLSTLQECLTLAQEEANQAQMSAILGSLGETYIQLGQIERAKELFRRTLAVGEREMSQQTTATYLGYIAVCDVLLGRVTAATVENLQRAVTISREVADRGAEIVHLFNLASAYSYLGQFKSAIACYQKALIANQSTDRRRQQGRILCYLGTAYFSLERPEEAIEALQEALVVCQGIGEQVAEADCLGELGRVYTQVGRVEQAIDSLMGALAITRAIGACRDEGHWLGHLGTAYYQAGRHDQALELYQQALTISRREDVKDRRHEGIWLGFMGTVYRAMGQLELALPALEEATTIAGETNDRHYGGRWWAELGRLHRDQGNVTEARRALERAMNLMCDTDLPIAGRIEQELEELHTFS
ncbi:MAG: tetratricopeptide repeat protein [Chloroflexota bacterium]